MSRITILSLALWFPCFDSVVAQRGLTEIPDPDPELERKELIVPEGFEINLYAGDPLIAKPIQMNFDSRGRLWIASSEIYPQIEPGKKANDKVLVLDDTDHDGVADSTEVFADGLLIPTGVLPGDGGVYVANSTELLHLSDSDGDGKADRERVVLSGFGTEDTHHILHTLRWGPECTLYMNQSIYIHSHIETPHGVRRMNGGGVWWFRPASMKLETFTLGCVNPWGHAWNRYGVSFGTDGAFGEGINYLFPGWVGITSPGAKRILHGLNKGKPKLCGLEFIDGTHLPPEWRGNLIANDFRAHRVCRYIVTPSETGFHSEEGQELVKSRHIAFRPIDVKMGPDGAIYIADWYNPIIQHGEVDFRDPRRDHVHGRIWRITAKDRPLIPRIHLEEMRTRELCQLLASPEPWRRQHAKQVLKARSMGEVGPLLRSWLAELDPNDADYWRMQLEAFWVFEAMNHIDIDLLTELLSCSDSEARAAATRVLHNWSDRVPNPLEFLQKLVVDEHPRVRLEAVRALSRSREPKACEIAMRALDYPVDEYLDYSLWHTARDLSDIWMPALDKGQINFSGNAKHLTFALRAVDTPDVTAKLLTLARSAKGGVTSKPNILATIANTSTQPDELKEIFDATLSDKTTSANKLKLLRALTNSTRRRKVKPSGNLTSIQKLVADENELLAAEAIVASGLWKIESQKAAVRSFAVGPNVSATVRNAALDALVGFGDAESVALLSQVSGVNFTPKTRIAAAAALIAADSDQGCRQAADVLSQVPAETDPTQIVQALLATNGAAATFAKYFAGKTTGREIAEAAIQQIESSGQTATELTLAFQTAGGIQTEKKWKLSTAERTKLLVEAKTKGSPFQGEMIYRRKKLMCLKCHSIAGSGGKVGPDLVSLGASAQPDYILESILEPRTKVKENYHSVVVITDQGKVISGIKLRKTDDELILRNAEDQIVTVPVDSIEEESDGGSLMPSGLLDSLSREELVHLVRFLTELGKVGRYSTPRETFIRSWQVPIPSTDATAEQIAESSSTTEWQNTFSRVDGSLPISELPVLESDGQEFVVVRCATEDLPSGSRLRISAGMGLRIWINGKQRKSGSTNEIRMDGSTDLVLSLKYPSDEPSIKVQVLKP